MKQKNHDICSNRRAYHDYKIEKEIEAGIQLTGIEVKSLRSNNCSLQGAFVNPENEDSVWLERAHIPKPSNLHASQCADYSPYGSRKLLLHKREIRQMHAAVSQKGKTIIPLKLYFNEKGIAKVLIGIATGKKKQDKRASEKAKEWRRDKSNM